MLLAGAGDQSKQMESVCGFSHCSLKQVDMVSLTEEVTSGKNLKEAGEG